MTFRTHDNSCMYKTLFLSRRAAGLELSQKLQSVIAGVPVVVGIPGDEGMSMANEVAGCLRAPVYPLPVCKLGVPGHDQLSMGAIAPDIQFLDRAMIERLHIDESAVDKVVSRERLELKRRKQEYLRKYGRMAIGGKTAILVDEGIVDNVNNIRAAVGFLLGQKPLQLLVAAPVVSATALKQLNGEREYLVWLHMPEPFIGIDHWYEQHALSDSGNRH